MAKASAAYRNRPVLVTGHTGFKGAWLCAQLLEYQARPFGYSLTPPTQPNLFEIAGLAARMDHQIGDVRNAAALEARIAAVRPEFIFHLAAQPLVRASYAAPAETFETNVQGVVNLLEAVRRTGLRCTVIVVTSDKCYENAENGQAFKETDPLGGHDPYSASKAAAEIVVSSYRRSFFVPAKFAAHGVALASVRAGNVIGGGDWALDRLVPDMVRALAAGKPLEIRHPSAVRPWQHVLDALGGYLLLGARLSAPDGAEFAEAWNFGPVDFAKAGDLAESDGLSVGQLADRLFKVWGKGTWTCPGGEHVREAKYLALDCSKAVRKLGWKPAWKVDETIERTAVWYRNYAEGKNMSEFTAAQIREHGRESGL